MTPRDITLGGLGLISLALLATIALEATRAVTPAPGTAAPAQPSQLPAVAVDDGAASVPVILARPLFSSDRRPKAGPASAGAVSDDMPRLSGIMIDRAQRHAIFQPSGDGKTLTLGEGDQVAGWQIQTITADSVTLTGPKGTQTLQPKSDPSLAGTATNSVDPMVPGAVPRPPPNNPRQFLPGGMQLPAGVPNPFAGQAVPTPARPVPPQQPSRQPGGAPAAPNHR